MPTNRPAVRIDTLGCKVNQAESEALARRFAALGWRLDGGDPDCYVLNTCAVTRVADAKARHLLSRARRHWPRARIVATGCYAERAAAKLAALPYVDCIVGNADKESLADALSAEVGAMTPDGDAISSRRARSFVKVSDGCDFGCAYCVVPLARGPARSRPADDVVAEVGRRVADGYQEVVLTGPQLGSYRSSDGDGIAALARRVLDDTALPRLRLSSLQPADIGDDLLALFGDGRLCRHLHLPLQSGSDATLRRMRRRYTTVDFAAAVARAHAAVEDIAITTDIMVGFPGETAAEFAASHDFCRQMGFARTHVFAFSPRPDTEAAQMDDTAPAAVKRRRVQTMIALGQEAALAFQRRCLGRPTTVLWESVGPSGATGLTDHYLRVHANPPDAGAAVGAISSVILHEDDAGALWGDPLRRPSAAALSA